LKSLNKIIILYLISYLEICYGQSDTSFGYKQLLCQHRAPVPAGAARHAGGGLRRGVGAARHSAVQGRAGEKGGREDRRGHMAGPPEVPGAHHRGTAFRPVYKILPHNTGDLRGLHRYVRAIRDRRELAGHNWLPCLPGRPSRRPGHKPACEAGDRTHRIRGRIVEQGAGEAGVGLQKTGRRHRHRPQQLSAYGVAAPGLRPAYGGAQHLRATAPHGDMHHRGHRPDGAGHSGRKSGQKRVHAPRLRQRAGRLPRAPGGRRAGGQVPSATAPPPPGTLPATGRRGWCC
jgi:hypothetical protein